MEPLLQLTFQQRNTTRLLITLFGILSFLLIKDHAKTCVALGCLLALMLRSPTFVYAFIVTIKRDWIALYRFVRLNVFMAYIEWKRWTVARIFLEQVRRYPTKPAFVMDDRTLTFHDVEELSNKVACYFKAQGYRKGDCVALIMQTRPEYPCLWLGLSKIGVITALVNSNLRRETLIHSITIAKAKAIIIGTELATVLQEVLHDRQLRDLPIYQWIDNDQRQIETFSSLPEAIDLCLDLKTQRCEDLSDEIASGTPRDKLLYVYTSGTTGLPKAAVVTNLRYVFMGSGVHQMLAITSQDVVYDPLPLYHTAGCIVGVGNALIHGCTVVLRKKFSASNFFKDCIEHNCTVAQYIGELCRYLLSTPAKPEDTQHRLRLMFGNGLRPQIWSQFVSRFNLAQIGELYGSTEGNSNLVNISNHVGAIGFVPIAIASIYPVKIVRCNEETGEPLRNAAGFCIRCKPGETGLFVGRVNSKRAVTAFSGYADKEASEKKLLRDVFRKGDLYFNSGDLVVGDILGYFYFKDRTGDTYRWRGENVATQEVEAIITNAIGLHDCVVYGVDVPHVEGKAGMAAIEDPERKVDLAHLSAAIRGSLPAYAQPLFVRLMNEIPRTATFKMKKRDLMVEAFDLRKVKDPIYYLNKDGIYKPLTEEQFEGLLHGKAGL